MSEEDQVLAQDAVEPVEAPETATEEPVIEPEKVAPEPVKERPVYTMPVAKAQEEKRVAVEKAKAEAQAEIERVRSEYEEKLKVTSPQSDFDKELETFSEKHGMDKEAAKELFDVYRKQIKLPDLSKYDSIVKEAEEKKIQSDVKSWIDDRVVPLIKKDNPNATPEQVAEIADKVQGLAFSEEYKGYRLEDIYRVKSAEFTPQNGFSIEGSRGRSQVMVDFKNLSDEEEHNLSEKDPEAFKRYLKFQEANSSKYLSND